MHAMLPWHATTPKSFVTRVADPEDIDVAVLEQNKESALSDHVGDRASVSREARVQELCRGKAGESIYDALNKLRKLDADLKRKADQ